jgi:hypothetical protein
VRDYSLQKQIQGRTAFITKELVMDQKTNNELRNAMERAKAHHQELKIKWEDKFWKQVDEPYRLIDALPMLTKGELDNI